MAGPLRLEESFIHLGPGATAVAQPDFAGGMEWYEGYDSRHGGDGREGRLVSQYTFADDWPGWEMHPHGSEVVICTAGSMMLTQEWPDGRREMVTLNPGDYAINPPGVWHIADVIEPTTAIFITAGEGTEHRPR